MLTYLGLLVLLEAALFALIVLGTRLARHRATKRWWRDWARTQRGKLFAWRMLFGQPYRLLLTDRKAKD